MDSTEVIIVDDSSTQESEKKKKPSKEERKAKRKEEEKNNPEKHNKVRRLFFGVGKEFWRISWLKKDKIFYWFLVVMLILIVFAIIFGAVAYISEAFINL